MDRGRGLRRISDGKDNMNEQASHAGLDTPRRRSWKTLRSSLRRIAVLIFLVAELAVTAVQVVFYSAGLVSGVRFLGNFVIYTAVILMVIIVTHYLLKKAFLDAYVSQSRLLSISDISTDAVFTLDADSLITAWSSGAERIFAYPESEALGQKAALLIPPDAAENHLEALRALTPGEFVLQKKATYRRKNGELFTAEMSASSFELPDAETGSTVVVCRDISPQLEMEDRAKQSEERYRNLFESSVDGIVAIGEDGSIMECNRAFADMLGYTRGELLRKTYTELTPPGWRSVDEDIIKNQIMRTGRSDEYMKEYIRKDGGVFPVSLRAWQITDRQGRPIGIWTTVKDISERRQYENFIRETIIRLEEANERLRDLDRLKVEFVAMVTHELRSPLGTIQSSLSALRSISPNAALPEVKELMGILERGVHRLSHLIEDLLDITRIESGQLRLKPEIVDAGEIASRALEIFRPLFEEKGLALVFEPAEEQCMAECDPGRIEQVLVNLLDNALRYTDSGEVRVRMDSARTRVIYSVIDTGLGIPPELHQKVFEKFSTIDTLREDGTPSIGLGLAICKGIVEAGGGNIWVESREQSGSTFSFDVTRVTGLE